MTTCNSAGEPTRFFNACYGKAVDRIPVWMMRQAGRYMPEYQALRKKYSFLELCQTPALAAQATLDAARILDTDAAIIFSDITVPSVGMGMELEFSPGPIFPNPIRSLRDVDALLDLEPKKHLSYVMEAIELTRKGLKPNQSLIGFVGAPLTLSAYMIEGTPTKNWNQFKEALYNEESWVEALLEKVTRAITAHGEAQIDAGCDAIQLFDTNAGLLTPRHLRGMAFHYAEQAITTLKKKNVPVIYFAKGISQYLEDAMNMKPDVLGLDWTVSMANVRRELKPTCSLMGNLDPTALFSTPQTVEKMVREILDENGHQPGFIFNLGHGILPKTPPENAKKVVDVIRSWSQENL